MLPSGRKSVAFPHTERRSRRVKPMISGGAAGVNAGLTVGFGVAAVVGAGVAAGLVASGVAGVTAVGVVWGVGDTGAGPSTI